MNTKTKMLGGLAALALLLGAGAAQATVSATFTFKYFDAGSQLVAGPFAQVVVTENAGALDFNMTMLNNFLIHDGNATHNAFDFSLTGDPSIKITGLPTNFSRASGSSFSAPPFGSFDYAIQYTGGAGYANASPGPLTFTVKRSDSVALHLSDLASQLYTDSQNKTHKIYFATDVIRSNGKTGNVAAEQTSADSGVPEPATWAMMILGMGMAGAMMRRRRAAIA